MSHCVPHHHAIHSTGVRREVRRGSSRDANAPELASTQVRIDSVVPAFSVHLGSVVRALSAPRAAIKDIRNVPPHSRDLKCVKSDSMCHTGLELLAYLAFTHR